MENHSYDQIVGVPDAPYLNRFASRGRLFTNFSAVDHPSLPNYLAITAGSTLGCPDDRCPRAHYRANNIFHQLLRAGRTWRSWEESMPQACYTERKGYPYAVRHNPAAYFADLFPHPCPRFDVRYPKRIPKRLADFTFVTPNVISDMHDGSIARGDRWLRRHVPPLLERGAIVIIVFDEGEGSDQRIYCAERGPGVPRGVRDHHAYTHYGLLAGIERHFGLHRLLRARWARALPI
jgi:hypothetical protein